MAATCIGLYAGSQWQIIRNYETFIFPFSRYSWHLHDLVERQDLTSLTNDVIIFDKMFNARQDPKDIQNAVNAVFKYGSNFQTNANKGVAPAP